MTVTRTLGNRRRGFALVLVLILVAVAAVLGMSYLQSASVRRMGAENLLHAARSKYLAESGLQHAMYMLQSDLGAMQASSAASPLGPYYVDQAQQAPYYFYATAYAGGDPGEYILMAEATSNGVTQRCTAKVRRAAAPERTFDYGVTINAATILPASVSIIGSVYVSDSYSNLGTVDGDAFSSATLSDPFLLITGTRLSDVADESIAPLKASDYEQYELHDEVYQWTVTDPLDRLEATHPVAGGGAVTAGNPGGVVQLVPAGGDSVVLGQDLQFEGTLIIYGNLIVEGTGVYLKAVKGFPAVVVTGNLYVRRDASVRIDGFVYTSRGIVHNGDAGDSYSTINGGVYCGEVGFSADLTGSHQVTEITSRRTIFDFSENANLPKVEVLRWNQ